MKSPLKKSRQIVSLTGMRAFLISWIVVYHLKAELEVLFPFQRLIDFAATGFLGVDFFFITSGFIIAYNYAARFKRFDVSIYQRFLWLRLARIYPVHLFSLLLVSLMFAAAKISGSELTNPNFYTASSFLQNIFLLQAWSLPTTFSWNAVSWAVSTEWLAYLAFPLIISLTLRIRHIPTVLICMVTLLWLTTAACLMLDATWAVPYGAGSYGLLRMGGEFIAGCLLYNLYMAGWGSQWCWGWITALAWAAVFIGSIILNSATHAAPEGLINMSGQLNVLWITPLCALAIYALAWERGVIAQLLSTKPIIYGGHISYALYLTHFICLIVLRRAFPIDVFAGTSFGLRLGAFAGYLLVMIATAVLTYRLIEEPGRRWMKSLTVSKSKHNVRTQAIAHQSEASRPQLDVNAAFIADSKSTAEMNKSI